MPRPARGLLTQDELSSERGDRRAPLSRRGQYRAHRIRARPAPRLSNGHPEQQFRRRAGAGAGDVRLRGPGRRPDLFARSGRAQTGPGDLGTDRSASLGRSGRDGFPRRPPRQRRGGPEVRHRRRAVRGHRSVHCGVDGTPGRRRERRPPSTAELVVADRESRRLRLGATPRSLPQSGSSVPVNSATMYAAYQSGQLSSGSPMRFSCSPCAAAARRRAPARSEMEP
jgi:hypothetical protein